MLDRVELVLPRALLEVLEVRGEPQVALPRIGQLGLQLLAIGRFTGGLLLGDARLEASLDRRSVVAFGMLGRVLARGHICALLTKQAT